MIDWWSLKLKIEVFKLAIVTLALFVLYRYRRIFMSVISPKLLKRGVHVMALFWFAFIADVMKDVYPMGFTKDLDDIILSAALILGMYYMVDYMRSIRIRVVPTKIQNGNPTLPAGAYIFTNPDISNVLNLVGGKKVIALTRNPEPFEKRGLSYIWLSKVPGENAIDPLRLPAILHKLIESADKDTAVIIDGIEYLVLENGFNSVVKFLTTLKDNLLLKEATLIVLVEPEALEPSQLAILRREFSELTPETGKAKRA